MLDNIAKCLRCNKLSAIYLFIVFSLAGCGQAPTLPDNRPKGMDQSSIDDVKQLLELAQTNTSPLQETYYLQAAQILAQQNEYDWARNLLMSLNADMLSDSDFIDYILLFSDVAMQDDSFFLAQRILTTPRLEQSWDLLPEESQKQLGQRRADLFSLLGNSLSSVKERIRLSTLLVDKQEDHQNQDAIWQTLMMSPRKELEHYSVAEPDNTLRGWYTLAALSKNNQTNLEQQLNQVDNWANTWPQHPASQRLPNDLQLLRNLIQNSPQNIALLLPLDGKLEKAGKAIRDGFFASFYQAKKQLSQIPNVQVYNTHNQDIQFLYNQAVTNGAELIIGPLDKQKVTTLSQETDLPIPVLAMNYRETQPLAQEELTVGSQPDQTIDINTELVANEPPPTAEGFFQFGLAVEDEARQAARRAWLEGHRNAMIIHPRSNWGDRSAIAFSKEWNALGGEVVNRSSFENKGNFSKVIERALLVENSQHRKNQLRRLFGHSIEFEPRRRKDVDMIFLVASAKQARQIKPTLAFHYASKIPVYATRHIYTGHKDKKVDRDLNGIRFSTLPWSLDDSSTLKQTVSNNISNNGSYNSLYALGIDAYRLYPRLEQLRQIPTSRLYGATGALQLLPDGKVTREQTWAIMRGGLAKALPSVVSDQQEIHYEQ